MKSYHNDIKNEFYRDAFIAIDLLELQFVRDNGTSIPRYYTSAGMNIDAVSNLTGSTVTYTAQGDFMTFSTMSETMDLNVGQFSIQISGLTPTILDDIANNNSEGKRVIIKKAFLNPSTLQLIQSPIEIYSGYVFNYAITEARKTVSVNLKCASLFSDFERSAGRKTNNWSNWLFQGVQYDKAMDKAAIVGQTEFLWGKTK